MDILLLIFKYSVNLIFDEFAKYVIDLILTIF